jgi:hypothetical protein
VGFKLIFFDFKFTAKKNVMVIELIFVILNALLKKILDDKI